MIDMTPQEKANQLFQSFGVAIAERVDVDGFVCNTEQAKQCALICVDEILDVIKVIPYGMQYLSARDYFEEVKEEIEKL